MAFQFDNLCYPVLDITVCTTKHRRHLEEEWEAVKGKIEELWMSENLPLSQVIAVLENEDRFRASPKQYKDRFRRWGWAKYRKCAPATQQRKVRPRVLGKSCVRPTFPKTKRQRARSQDSVHQRQQSHDEPPPSHKDPLMHSNSMSRHLFAVVHSTFVFMTGSFDRESHWRDATQHCLIGGFEYPFSIIIFQKALQAYGESPNRLAMFGRLIRRGFLEVERIVRREDPIFATKVLFEIPYLLAAFGHAPICAIYLQHVVALYRQRKCNYPLIYIAEALQKLFNSTVGKDPSRLDEFKDTLVSATQAWVERFGSLEKRLEYPERPGRTYFWLEYMSHFVKGWTPNALTAHYVYSDTMAHLLGGDSVQGTEKTLQLEADLIVVRSVMMHFDEGFEESALGILRRAAASENNADVRLSSYRGLADYYYSKQEWSKVLSYQQLCCDTSGDRRDVYTLYELEIQLQAVGCVDDARRAAAVRQKLETRLDLENEDWECTTWTPHLKP